MAWLIALKVMTLALELLALLDYCGREAMREYLTAEHGLDGHRTSVRIAEPYARRIGHAAARQRQSGGHGACRAMPAVSLMCSYRELGAPGEKR
jgi:hypothetical protein